MSDIATCPNATNAPVVASTIAPAHAVRRSNRRQPSHSVASSTPSAAIAGTTRAAPGSTPNARKQAAISQ